MSTTQPCRSDCTREIRIDDDSVEVDHLRIENSALAGLLLREPEEGRPALLSTIIEVGTRGVITMGMGMDLDEIDARVKRSIEAVTDRAEATITSLLERAQRDILATLDPDQRQSVMSRTLQEFSDWRSDFLTDVDPDQSDGRVGRLFAGLTELLGEDGPLEARLRDALDPTNDASAIAVLASQMDRRFNELRDVISTERGRRQEADRGTQKGFEFEDELEVVLREACRPISAIVERTSHTSGLTGTDALVGDFAITLPTGQVIAIEAKHTKTIGLTGADGILDELDRAMANRGAAVGICVSKTEAFPMEVGPFGVYGNRILAVDDGEGTLVRVALRWAQMMCHSEEAGERGQIDIELVRDRLDRVKQLAQRFSSNRRALTGIAGSVEQVRSSLEGMRTDLLELIDDVDRAVAPRAEAAVLPITLSAG